MTVYITKTHPDVKTPVYSTDRAACFDIFAFIPDGSTLNGYNLLNYPFTHTVENGRFLLSPGARILIPTGLIFSLPVGYSVRLHPRSGTALKKGLTLPNAEGVIDEDYKKEVFGMFINTSKTDVVIEHGERICQGELVKDTKVNFIEIPVPVEIASNREGGFGSTGTL